MSEQQVSERKIHRVRLEAIRDWDQPQYSTGVHVSRDETVQMAARLLAAESELDQRLKLGTAALYVPKAQYESMKAELTRKLEELTPLLSNAIRERNKYDAECDRLEAKVEDLEAKLAAMTEDRDLWKSDHDGDCPYKGQVEEQQSLIRELERERDLLRRLYGNTYLPFQKAGGPNECAHGVAAGIACWPCDIAALAKLPKDTVTPKL